MSGAMDVALSFWSDVVGEGLAEELAQAYADIIARIPDMMDCDVSELL